MADDHDVDMGFLVLTAGLSARRSRERGFEECRERTPSRRLDSTVTFEWEEGIWMVCRSWESLTARRKLV